MRYLDQLLLSGACLIFAEQAQAAATKIIDNGPDAGKKIIAVLGDGFTSAEQSAYNIFQVG